jgi:hypothetical protein
MLNAAAILAEAERHTGIADSDPTVHANLERLVAALNRTGGLSAMGAELTDRNFRTEQATCEFRSKPARDSDVKPATIPG